MKKIINILLPILYYLFYLILVCGNIMEKNESEIYLNFFNQVYETFSNNKLKSLSELHSDILTQKLLNEM